MNGMRAAPVVFLWVALGWLCPLRPAMSATIIDLGTYQTLKAGESPVYAINNAGQVVGWVETTSGRRACLFQGLDDGTLDDGDMIDLGILPSGISGQSEAYGINNFGAVVGYSDAIPNARAFLYQDDDGFGTGEPGVMTDLGTPGSGFSHSYAYAISDKSDDGTFFITGDAVASATGVAYAFLYSSDTGTMVSLKSFLGDVTSTGQGVNNVGHVVGWVQQTYGTSAFLFPDANGEMVDLGTRFYGSSQARAINDDNSVVGSAWSDSGGTHAFLYRYRDNVMTDLGTLQKFDLVYFGDSYAFGINNAGHVVGRSSFWGDYDHAFLFRDLDSDGARGSGEMVDLNDMVAGSGWTLVEATDINNKGEIVGWGIYSGFKHAFLLTPDAPPPVNNPPTADAGGPYSVIEGGTVSLTGTGDDPDADDVGNLQYEWDFDYVNGSFNVDAIGLTTTFDAASLDGPYEVQVAFRVCDPHGACVIATAPVSVSNVAPVIETTTGPNSPVAAGDTVSVSVTFSDPGSDEPHTASVDWGDGNRTDSRVEFVNGSWTASDSHIYANAGEFSVTITVTDKDGSSATASLSVVIEGTVVEKSWNVRAHGSIVSPKGAYFLDPELTGKASFSLRVANAGKGVNPVCELDFQIRSADFYFKGKDTDGYIVNGSTMVLQGKGTKNGAGEYSFLVTLTDGDAVTPDGLDRIALKVWSSAGVSYDNGLGTTLDRDGITISAPR